MKDKNSNNTVKFSVDPEVKDSWEIIKKVYNALEEKGYNPVNQLVGYFLSGDPTYITSHNNARGMIRKMERDELLEEIIKHYLIDIKKY